MQSRRGHAASNATFNRQNLFKHLISTALLYSPLTALFLAERLHALDTSLEVSVYFLALTLSKNNRENEALWLLRQPVVFQPSPNNVSESSENPFVNAQGSSSTPMLAGRRWTSSTRLTRPAYECSLRCARLYASCCLSLNRAKEGREALARVMLPGTPLTASETMNRDLQLSSYSSSMLNWNLGEADLQAITIELELARLAQRAGEHERAVLHCRRVLEAVPWCWEALQGLCREGSPPEPETLYSARPRPRSTSVSPILVRERPLPPVTNMPQPLGPSQTSAVNSSASFVNMRNRSNTSGPHPAGLGFFTPSDNANSTLMTGKGKEGRPKGIYGLSQPIAYSKKSQQTGYRSSGFGTEPSLDDSALFDSLYPSAPSFASVHHAPLQATNGPNPSNYVPPAGSTTAGSSFFTPPTITAPIVPGVKRPRGQVGGLTANNAITAVSSGTASFLEEEAKAGRRVVKSVPAERSSRRDGSLGAPTRRSSRLSRDGGRSSNGVYNGPTSTAMQISRSGNSRIGTILPNPRDKKRSKAGVGPSVLSDAGSEVLSPISHSSSPVPSSPGATQPNCNHHAFPSVSLDPALLEAEDYVITVMRCFGRAAIYASTYQCSKVIEALAGLSIEQTRTWRSLVGIGTAHLEMLSYDKAEKAFAQARQVAPHLLESMEMYSTLLWHLKLPTNLSFLAQDLMVIAPKSSTTWIASGNVFSHLEDHASALKCFKRAAQLDEYCVYAYTLSGHECVVLEEWERALDFFREAVRRDPRHYNAWFGLGNVYMQTGKYRLAEYHFRKAQDINKTNATLVCCVGSVLEKLGRKREAAELYKKACTLAPDSPAVRFKHVRILISLEKYEAAEVDLLSLKDRAPNEFNVHFLLGKLYKILGRESDMLKSFALAQDLEPRTASLIRDYIVSSSSSSSRNEHNVEMDDVDDGSKP